MKEEQTDVFENVEIEEDLINEEIMTADRVLQVGDKVRVRDLNKAYRTHADTGWSMNDYMRQHSHQIVTIASKFNESFGAIAYRIEEDEGTWTWHHKMFLANLEEPKREKVDDAIEKQEIVLKCDDPTDEEIKKMISLVDIKTFEKIIKTRLAYDDVYVINELKEDRLKDYLKEWARSKYRFYKMLGDKLTIETEVELEKDSAWFEQKREDIGHKFPIYYGFLGMFDLGDIKENRLTHRSWEILFEDKKIKEGMKFTRVAALFNNNDLNMEISKIYQDKATKKVKVSIDPCDYLTVSMNKHDWRSCHNFLDGEYRNAGLALMFDRTSLVSYSATENVKYNYDYRFPFTWNSKNWRQMIYISEDNSSMIFSLQYPYKSDEITKAVRELVEKQYSDYVGIPNKWRVSSDQGLYKIDVDCSRYMYNDAIRNGCKYVINRHDIKESTVIKTGAKGVELLMHEGYEIDYEDSEIW